MEVNPHIQWHELRNKDVIVRQIEEEWFRTYYELYKDGTNIETVNIPPTFDEIKEIAGYEKELWLSRYSFRLYQKHWESLFAKKKVKVQKKLLGYGMIEAAVEKEDIRTYKEALKPLLVDALKEDYQAWRASVSEEDVWNRYMDVYWLRDKKAQVVRELVEQAEDILYTQNKWIEIARKAWLQSVYYSFLTSKRYEEYEEEEFGNETKYRVRETEEPFTFENTKEMLVFAHTPTGNRMYPRYFSQALEADVVTAIETFIEENMTKWCKEKLFKATNEAVYEAMNKLKTSILTVIQAFYEPWFERVWAHKKCEDVLFEADRELENVPGELRQKMIQLMMEKEQNDIWRKELFYSQFEHLFQPRKAQRDVQFYVGPTNSGKTYQALKHLKQAKTGAYLGPLRLLAYEVRDELMMDGVACSLRTGEDEQLVPFETHMAGTVEMLDTKARYDVVAIDECQLMEDSERGFAWIKAMLESNARELHLISSPHAKDILLQLLEGENVTVHEFERQTPLEVIEEPFHREKIEKEIEEGDALIVFSKKKVLELASMLEGKGINASVIYGSMPAETRLKQVEQFVSGETKVIVSTDAIGMGLNLPIRRVILLEDEKFDGVEKRPLTSQEIKQIAGRAGRAGKFPKGYVWFATRKKKNMKKLFASDEPIQRIVVSPLKAQWKQFEKKSQDVERFFSLWRNFELDDPRIEKKSLEVEEKRYKQIKRLKGYREFVKENGISELVSYLSMPFHSEKEVLNDHYLMWMEEVFSHRELTEPNLQRLNSNDVHVLEDLYAIIGLYLLFKRQHAFYDHEYWEETKQDIAEKINDLLKYDKKKYSKKCKSCQKQLRWDDPYNLCQKCYHRRQH